MSGYLEDGYYTDAVANKPQDVRLAFIRRTYLHVAGATAALVGIEALLLNTGAGDRIFDSIRQAGNIGWLAVMALFIASGFISRSMARSRNSATQYLGLALYVAIEAVILLPILTMAERKMPGGHIAMQAGIMTLVIFGGLTAAVFLSGKDFSFLGTGLTVLGFGSIGLVIVAVITGMSLGIWFSFFMIALVCGYILYDTSNVMLHYSENEHVGAALELFADVATLFYYIVRLLMQSRN